MKRIYAFIAAALTIISAASCVQELANDPHQQQDAVVYKAIADGADAKAVLGTNESGRPQSMWEEGDMINIYIGGGLLYRFTTSLDEPSPVAEFKYTGAEEIDFSDVDAVIAAYPASISGWADPGMLPMLMSEISTFQKVPSDVDSYDRNAVPAVAYSTDRTLHFQNAASLLKFKVNQAGVSKVRFTSRNGEYLTGKVTIVLNDDMEIGYINPDEHGAPETLMDFAELSTEGTFQSDRTYYISIIPGTLETGFILEFLDSEGTTVYANKYDRTITIKRNVILDLGTLGKSASLESGDYIDEYGINHGQGVNIDGVVWAPVNCGYHETDFKYGKLYQWGRKYGQGYDDYDTITPVIENGCISLIAGNHQDNANKFYKGNNDWLYSGYSNLWNIGTESDPVKTEYDPCPEGWRVPTYAELEILSAHHSEWTTNEYGQNGYWFCGSAQYASGVSQVFLPAAGWRNWGGGIVALRGTLADYWSSSFDLDNQNPSRLAFDNSAAQMGSSAQAYGFSLRCVQADSELIPVTDIVLDKTSLSIEVGDNCTLIASISPVNANHKYAYWHSDNASVAAVDENGKLTAVSTGTAMITAIAGMYSVQCEVTVVAKDVTMIDYVDESGVNHGPGVEINGVVWAPVNCGYHETDFKWGKLYQWGRKYGQGYIGGSFADAVLPELKAAPVSLAEGQAAENENVFFNIKMQDSFRDNNWSDGEQSGLWNSGTEHSPIKTEYDPCPDGWRVPTSEEMSSLESVAYSWIRESQPEYNGVYGTVVADDSGLREAFFPASGYLSCSDASGIDRGRYHLYWTSNYNDRYPGGEIGSIFGSNYSGYQQSSFGMSVRCVQDESPLVKVESLTINTTSVSMTEGETCTISAEVFPSDANQNTALWYSDTPSVAIVDKDGNIKALSAGTAKIIAMAGMKVAECEVTVKASPFVGTWSGTMYGMYAQYPDVKFIVTFDPEDGLIVSAGINPYFIMNGIDWTTYKASIEGNQLVVYAEQPSGYDDTILLGFNHADPNVATEYDHIRFVLNEDGTLTQTYAFGAYTANQGGWFEVYWGGGTFVKDQNAIEDMPKIEL